MKIIEKLEDLIDEEIHDAKNYAKMAAELKAEHPGMAQVLYNIAAQEMDHQSMLHAEVVKLIDQHRRTKGEPPAAMMAVYEYLHKKHVDKAVEARRYMDAYKNM
jgi:rubrerythrin